MTSSGLPGWHLQPLLLPDPLYPFVVHFPAGTSQQGSDPPVTVPTEPAGQPHNVVGQSLLVVPNQRLMALGRAGLLQHPASPTL